jgi:hypothetical protein
MKPLIETSDYNPASKPWMVEFHVVEHEIAQEFIPRRYWVRAAKPDSAIMAAGKLFVKWEKEDAGRGAWGLPKIAGPAIATAIDEQDWFKFLKESAKWPRLLLGSPFNPGGFTYFTDEAYVKQWFGPQYFNPNPQPIDED